MHSRKERFLLLTFAFLLLAQVPGWTQSRNLTVAVLVNSQNAAGYNTNPANPGEFQRFAERYLQHLQVPYELFDIATAAPPADLNSRQLIIAGHSHLLLPANWRTAIANAVSAGTGFVNLDSDPAIGNDSHMASIFGATGSAAGTPATQISIPTAVAPNGATPHFITALQKKFDDPSGTLVYPFHAGADGIVRSATSTVLTNATGTVIARLGADPLILAKTSGAGRAVHFGTLDYLHADRFGFLMGVDDLFWRSLVWAARKPFVVRGYPRLWAVQMDDDKAGWGSRVGDLYDTNLTGQKSSDGTGGPWKVTGFVFTDNLEPASADRTSVIAAINAGKLEVSPHSFGDANLGNMYWDGSNGPLTDQKWLNNMSLIDAWRQGNGGTDTIPSLSRSMIGHYWDLSDNIGYDLWNHYGFRYITSIIKPGFPAVPPSNGAERLPARSFWLYEMPPKTAVDPNWTTENYPLFFADDFVVRSRAGLPAQNFFLFATQYTDFAKYGRVDFSWPGASSTNQTVASSVAQLQQYTWRHWSSLGPLQLFTHDSINYENSTVADRQAVISQSSSWLNSNSVRHTFMDDLGDYIYARTKSTLTRANFDGSQLAYTFVGTGANADGTLIPTQLLVFQGDSEGAWQTIPGFGNGLQLNLSLPPSIQSTSPSTGPISGGTSVTITGTGFTSGTTVFFGPNSASSVSFVNSSTLQAVTPAAASATSVDVRVVTGNGNATLPGGFTYLPTPPVCPCSVWTTSATPSVIDSGDSGSIEVGVKFRSDANGFITGLRFYKSVANTGTHVGHLWTSTGTLLGSATFTNETASGWQQVTFSSPVAITAGTTYVASYFAPNGHYSRNSGQFASAGIDNTPLHLLGDGVDGGNGVFIYGATPTFPNSSFQSTNYWVDVIFDTAGTPSGPTVTAMIPASGASGVSTTTAVSATFSVALNPATVTTTTFRLLDPSNNPVTATVAYNNSNLTATLTPAAALLAGVTYRAVVTGGSTGVKDTSGNPMSADVSWLFTTLAAPTCPCSIWPTNPTPSVIDSGDSSAVEVGVKFRSDVNGFITGLRFYKSTANTGTHLGHLWTSTGTLLTSATFTNETASGWQQVTFSSPIAITAGTTYVASYYAPNGHYSRNSGQFASAGVDNAPLHALADGVDGGNGVFIYGAIPTFPTSSFQSTNYWVDVIFNATGSPPVPTVTSMSPDSGASGVGITTTVSATFNVALNSATVTTSTFRLLDPSNNPVAATVAYNNSNLTATLTPAAALLSGVTYRAVVTGGSNGVKDTSGNPMSADVSWLFTTQAGPTCPCSIWPTNPTPSVIDSGDNGAVEVGVKFRSDVNGFITGLRFYKSAANTGTHVGHLWTSTGTLLGSATFTNEAASGWQQVTFSSPVAITAGTTYVASYFAPNGRYSRNSGQFASAGIDNAPLHALADGVDGGNGVFIYGSVLAFPNSSFQSTNYWVDVIFDTTQTVALGSVSVNPTAVQGGNPSTGTATLTAPAPAGGVTVTLSSSNTTVASVPASVTIPASATSATFTITTSTVSSSTPVTLTGSYQGTDKTATLTVNPTNVAAISNLTLNPISVTSGATSTGTITLDSPAPPTTGAVVALSSDNTSAATVPATVTIAAGATTGTFTITTLSVAASTPVTISASYNGVKTAVLSVNPASGGISALSLSPTSVVSGGTSTGTITLTIAAPTGGAVVGLSSADTTVATVPASVTVAAGANSATFTVSTSGVASNSTVAITATYSGSSRSANLTVTPAALSTVSISPATVVGGVSSTGTVTLNGNAPTGGAVVSLSDTNAAATVPASVTVPAGQKTATFTITTVPVTGTTTGTVSGNYNGVVRNSSTLTVNPPAISSITLSPSTLLGGAQSTGTVTLSGATAAAETVALSTTNSAATVPVNVTVPAGARTATFVITTVPVLAVTTGTVSATYRSVTRTASLTVNPPALSTLTLTPSTLVGGLPSTGTVTLTGAVAADTSVTLNKNNAAVTIPANVVVTAGSKTATFAINTTPVNGTTSVTISATYNGVTRNATLVLQAPQLASLTLNPASVTVGTPSTGTVTLNGPAQASGTSVSLSSSNRSVATVPSSVLVPSGQTSATFTINTLLPGTATISGIRGVTRSATLTVTLQ